MYRVRDPTRHPDPPARSTKPSAPIDRKHIMDDAANTTISLTLVNFQKRYLPMDPTQSDAFKSRYNRATIQAISQGFRMGWKQAQRANGGRAKEKALSEVWAKIDEKYELCPDHFLHLSESKYEGGDDNKYKIDGSYIRKEDKHNPLFNEGVPNWALQKFSVEFKRGETRNDPYDDKGSIESETGARQEVRGQLMSYAEHVYRYQHRTALFFLFVNGNTFRIMRWDRSGVIVSEAEDYLWDLRKTRVLLELLFSFSQMSEKDQGIDATAEALPRDSCGWRRMDALAQPHDSDLESTEREVSPPQVEAFLHPKRHSHASYIFGNHVLHTEPTTSCNHKGGAAKYKSPVFAEVRTFFRNSISTDFPRYVLKVGDRRFLVGKPIFCTSDMVSRGTRGYVALDWETQRFVFLKDAWRPYYEGLVPEGETLRKLNEKGVCGVPTHVCDEDVPNQVTETSKFSVTGPYYQGHRAGSQEEQGSELRHLHHYRLVVAEVCLPSTEFENIRQLTNIIYDSIQAHCAAYTLCRIIHRDISAGNILILPKVVERSGKWRIVRYGILSDWELSKEVGITHDMQPHRTGTWPFMARRCIDDPHAIVGVPEEIESFLYVHLYHATRFLPTSIPPPMSRFMTAFFDGYEDACPPAKTASVQLGKLMYNGKCIELQYRDINGKTLPHPCNALIDKIFIHLKARYDMLELLEVQAVKQNSEVPLATYDDMKALEEEVMFRRNTVRILSPPAPAAPHNPEVPAPTVPAVDAPSDSNAPVVDPVPAEMRSRAEKLDTHDWVLSIFDEALYGSVKLWPKQDKIEDQLARYKIKEWHSNPSADMPSAGASAIGGKRLRGSDSGSTRAPRAKKAKKGKGKGKGKATKRANDDVSTEADEVQEPVTKRTRKVQRVKEAQEPVQKPDRGSCQGPATRLRRR